jgi:beta-mannosidase
MRELVLDTGWQLKEWPSSLSSPGEADGEGEGAIVIEKWAQGPDSDWIPALVPGLVHEALLAAGRIADPVRVRSHPALEPTFQRDYLYRCRFDLPEGETGAAASLCFDGLDTIATVWLNGREILRSDNMFVPREVEVGDLVQPRGNTLYVRFESALRVGQQRQAAGGPRPVWNGDPSRVYVRKAQYHYGWDFGPTLLSAGPWRPVRLRFGGPRLFELHAPITVPADLESATIAVKVTAAAAGQAGLSVALQLLDPRGQVITQSSQPLLDSGAVHSELRLADPELWWPRIYGAQPLYTLRATLSRGEELLDTRMLRLGVRRLRLLQEPLPGGGESFCFEINNEAIFCGGANWIPADLLNPRVTREHYEALLHEAAAAEMTMLRVWGGGIYEDDTFYDLCDELGILVFQDFMFACGMYPGDDRFAASIKAEATAAVRRLRHHPSLVLWAGNNEDYSIAQSTASYDGPQTAIPTPATAAEPDYKARFDGRRLYEQVLPEAVAAHDRGPGGPSRPYWPGSPYSRHSADPNAREEGDRHIWEVWHSPLRPYQDYPLLAGRFVSEFGMQAVPSRPTLERALAAAAAGPGPELTKEALALLNKGQDGPARIDHYIAQNLPPPRELDEYIYATQLIQAEALGYAVRGFRRGFGAHGGRAVSGALVWQLDDCWPGVSWAILEHLDSGAVRQGQSVRRKPAFYAVRRELLPLVVALGRAADRDHAVELWAAQSAGHPLTVRLRVRAYSLDGQQVLCSEREVVVGPNQVTELGLQGLPASAGPLVVGAQLWEDTRLLARAVLWPQPLRELPLLDPEVALELQAVERSRERPSRTGLQTLRVRARRPAKAVLLTAGPQARFSDNLLDLLPDEEVVVTAEDLGAAPLGATSLYAVRS